MTTPETQTENENLLLKSLKTVRLHFVFYSDLIGSRTAGIRYQIYYNLPNVFIQ